MNVVGDVWVAIRGEGSKFAGDAEKTINDGIGPAAKKAAGIIGGLFVGKAAIGFAKEGISELEDVERVGAQTEAQLKATGGAAGVTADHLDELAQSGLALSGVDDELIKSAGNVLLQFTSIKAQGGIFDRTLKDSQDLAQTLGIDVTAAAKVLGRALEAPEAAGRSLRAANVILTQSEKDQITAFKAAGDEAGAQEVILKRVEAQVGGTAEAFGKTLPGQVKIAQEELKNAKAELVGGFAPAISLVATVTTTLSQGLEELPAPLKTVTSLVLGGAVAYVSLARPINEAISLSRTLGIIKTTEAAQTALATEATIADTAAKEASLISQGGFLAGLGSVSIVALPVVATLGILGKSYLDTQSQQADATATTREYTKALLDQNGVIDDNVDKVTAQKLVDAGITPLFEKAGITAKSFADEVRNGGKPLADLAFGVRNLNTSSLEWAATLRDAKRSGDPFVQNLVTMFEQGKISAEQLRKLANSAHDLSTDFTDGKKAAGDQATALETVSEITGDATGATDDMTQALADQKAALDGAKKAVDDQKASVDALAKSYQDAVDGTLSQFEAQLRLSDAQIAERKAIAELDDARKKGNLSNDEGLKLTNDTFDAILNEAEAAKTLAEAMATGKSETDKATAGQQALIQELYGVAATLAPGSDLQQQVGEYIRKLQATSGPYETQIGIDQAAEDDARAKIAAFAKYVSSTLDQFFGVEISFIGNKGPGPQRRAAGGDYAPGPLLVGEGGRPELLFPRESGTVVSNARILAALGAPSGRGGGDGSVIVQVDARGVPDPWAVGRAVGSSVVEAKWRFPRR